MRCSVLKLFQLHLFPFRGDPQPLHRYKFHTSILLVNRAIHREARYIFYNENMFVSISNKYPWDETYLQDRLEWGGLPILARGDTARRFETRVMDVVIGILDNKVFLPDEVYGPRFSYEGLSAEHSHVVIAGDDLELFCRSYLHLCRAMHGHYDWSSRAFLLVNVLSRKGVDFDKGLASLTGRTGRVRRLLETFRQLHSIGKVYIIGDVEESYGKDIARDIGKPPPNAEDLLASVSAIRSEGDQHFDDGDLGLALARYEAIVDAIDAGYEWPPESGKVFIDSLGRGFLSEGIDVDISLLQVDTRIRMAHTCIALENPQKLRTSAWIARYQLVQLKDYLDPADYHLKSAEVWYQLAVSSKAMDKLDQAEREICCAKRYDGDNITYEAEREVILKLIQSAGISLQSGRVEDSE